MTTTLPLEGSTEQLGARISGQVLTPGSPGFDVLRQGWNLTFTHNPAVIVVPASAADVATAVRHAAEHHMHVVVQATGHGPVTTADGAMLIVTRPMDRVAVDADAGTARIGAGAKWQDVLGPATAVGLAPLLGSTPDVGVVGYTLGGGMGWIARKYGLSADHVRAIEIVTADGVIRRTDPEREPDLFWALRGGGAGSFGVVTAIEIDLVPLESLYAGNLLYPPEMAGEIAARYREWIADAPDELTSSICLMNFPPVEDVPEPLRGRSFTIVRGAFIGSDADGESLLQHWRAWRAPDIDLWGRMPFDQIATVSNDPLDPLAGLATTEWFDSIDDQVIDILEQALFDQEPGGPLLFGEIRHAGGAVARPPEYPNAYGNRQRQHVLEVVGVIPSADDMPALEERLTDLRKQLAPHVAGGAYINFLDGPEKARRSAEGFEPEAWERLRRVKAHYDPDNVFSHGVAIPSTGG